MSNIDWSQVVTASMKAEQEAAQLLANVQYETVERRKVADAAIAPLQDAVDIGESTAAERNKLLEWKRYRVALNRLADNPGYPSVVSWPAQPK